MKKKRRKRRPRAQARPQPAAPKPAPDAGSRQSGALGDWNIADVLREIRDLKELSANGLRALDEIEASGWPAGAAAENDEFIRTFDGGMIGILLQSLAATIRVAKRYRRVPAADAALEIYAIGMRTTQETLRFRDIFGRRTKREKDAAHEEAVEKGRRRWEALDPEKKRGAGQGAFMDLRDTLGELGWTSDHDRELCGLMRWLRNDEEGIRTVVRRILAEAAAQQSKLRRTTMPELLLAALLIGSNDWETVSEMDAIWERAEPEPGGEDNP